MEIRRDCIYRQAHQSIRNSVLSGQMKEGLGRASEPPLCPLTPRLVSFVQHHGKCSFKTKKELEKITGPCFQHMNILKPAAHAVQTTTEFRGRGASIQETGFEW